MGRGVEISRGPLIFGKSPMGEPLVFGGLENKKSPVPPINNEPSLILFSLIIMPGERAGDLAPSTTKFSPGLTSIKISHPGPPYPG